MSVQDHFFIFLLFFIRFVYIAQRLQAEKAICAFFVLKAREADRQFDLMPDRQMFAECGAAAISTVAEMALVGGRDEVFPMLLLMFPQLLGPAIFVAASLALVQHVSEVKLDMPVEIGFLEESSATVFADVVLHFGMYCLNVPPQIVGRIRNQRTEIALVLLDVPFAMFS